MLYLDQIETTIALQYISSNNSLANNDQLYKEVSYIADLEDSIG